jgi:hypothetical protein
VVVIAAAIVLIIVVAALGLLWLWGTPRVHFSCSQSLMVCSASQWN